MALDADSLDDLYPFASRYYEASGGRMHFVDEGAGHAVVMLHGNPTWSFYYRELIKSLSDNWRIIAPDHIGCGLSDKPPGYSYTLSSHIDNLEALLDHLGVEKATLAMHDWGGAIGFGLALRRPELCRRFVIFNTAAFIGPCPLRIRICRPPLLGDVLVRGLNLFVRGAIFTGCRHRENMTAAVKRGYLLPYRTWADRVAVLSFVRDIPLRPTGQTYRLVREIEASLSRFRSRPALILWGGKDFCFNSWYLGGWIARFPHAEVHEFEDAGHLVVEDAHDRVVPLMRGFLSNT